MTEKIELEGILTPQGEIHYALPRDLPEGEFDLVVHVRPQEITTPVAEEDLTWTDEELAELRASESPKSGAEIVKSDVIGSWADIEGDSVDWVEAQRQKRRERNQW